jgi:signal transduction histidine kinase
MRERLSRASLGTKLVLCSTVLILAAVAGSFLALSLEIRSQTKRLLADTLAQRQALILDVQRRRLEELFRTSALLIDSPTLRAALEIYRTESAADPEARTDLLATIQEEADKVADTLGSDLLVITDDRGMVVASSGGTGFKPTPGEDLSSHEVVHRALDPALPGDARDFAVLELHDRYFRVGSVPIVLQGFNLGAVVIGDAMDQAFIEELRDSFDCEIVLSVGERVIATTLSDPSERQAIAAAFLEPAPVTDRAVPLLRTGREEYVAALLSVGSDGRGRPIELHLLDSLSVAVARSMRSLVFAVLAYGLASVLLAALAAWVVSRSVLRPLTRFVTFMRSVADSGDRRRRFEGADAGHELRTLIDTYNRLIDSLEEHERELLRRAARDLEQLERLKESEKLAALGRLLSGAAHEINNPLTGVVGNVEMLLKDPRLDGEVGRRLETVRKEGRRIVALVRSLLRVARRDGGERTIVDLNRAVSEAVALRKHDFVAAGIRLEVDLAPGEARIHGNDLELQQVFLNIVNNAFDALEECDRPPRLRVRTAVCDDRVVVTFTDNGPGVPDPHQIFEHFYTTKPVGKGTGLGLSISQAIVSGHGGTIGAESVEGGGARFTLSLPAAVGEAAPASPLPDRVAGSFPARERALRASVLVVDDEPSVLELQMAILDSLGATAVGVEGGAEAVRHLESREFDLIVSDLKMPGPVSGKDLFRWVEANRRSAVSSFLFVTGDTIGETAFLEQARVRCVRKPFTLEEYVSALRETLQAPQHAA